MEAVRSGMYTSSWVLTIEFAGEKEQHMYGEEKLRELIQIFLDYDPWKDKNGRSCNKELEIAIALKPETHPDYGPQTGISFRHRNLLLSPKQLWAYEEWAHRLSWWLNDAIRSGLKSLESSKMIESDSLTHRVEMSYRTPLVQSDESYAVASDKGDVVKLPCGTLAVVTSYDFDCGGNVKILKLMPLCGMLRRFWLAIRGKLQPWNEEINSLVKVGEIPVA